MTGSKYHLSKEAYAKIILHAAKYPLNPVYGILLGSSQGSPTKSSTRTIIDATPIFHNPWLLTPYLQIAMEQIEFYTSQNELVVLGAYSANEVASNTSVEEIVGKAAIQLNEKLPGSLLLVLNAQGMQNGKELVPYTVVSNNSWKELQSNLFSKDDGSNEYAKSLIKNKAYANLHDFDEHLEDIELHWIGTPLASALLGSGTQRSR